MIQQDKPQEVTSLRLAVSLNYAVFFFFFYNDKKGALRMLKFTIGEALDDFDKWKKSEIDFIKK